MALINCPECGKQISDRAKVCVHCGINLQTDYTKCPECGSFVSRRKNMCQVCGCPIDDIGLGETSFMDAGDSVQKELLTEKTAVELINYIQFSVAKIINGKSKGLLEDEFDTVINNINPSSLQNMDLIVAYDELLKSLTVLKLNENQREQARKVLAKKKKAAVTHSLNSFGSVFIPGTNLVTMFASAVYTGISAVMNYKRAVGDAEMGNDEEEFSINQSDLECIDSLRSDLFISTAKVFANKSNTVSGLVSENEMKQFASCANSIENGDVGAVNSILALMESAENVLKAFPPYWVVMAVGYDKTGKHDSCVEALDRFDNLMLDNPIFKKNPYVLISAKTRISNILGNIGHSPLTESDKKIIAKSIEIIKANTPSLQQETDNLNFDLAMLYGVVGNFDGAEKSIRYLKTRQLIEKNSRLETHIKLLQDGALKDPASVFIIEKAFSSFSFGIPSEYTVLSGSDAKIDYNNFYIFSNSEPEIRSLCFSLDGKTDKIFPRIKEYKVRDKSGAIGFICMADAFTWNNLAEHPIVEICAEDFSVIYRVSIEDIAEDWPYQQTVWFTNRITGDITLLGDKNLVSQFKNSNSSIGTNILRSVSSGRLLNVVEATLGGMSKVLSDVGKKELTWLKITLIALRKRNNGVIRLVDFNKQPMLEDFRRA